MSDFPLILSDLGERRIVAELILPHFPKVKRHLEREDDCAVIPITRSGVHLFTSDACPLPIVFQEFDQDYFHYGWLTVTINASDIASMGGKPHTMVLSVDAPQTMRVADFRRMIAGVQASAQFHGVDVVGGNIRDTAGFALHAAMTGWACDAGLLTRSAARPGDYIVVFGESGHFWLSIMLAHARGFPSACSDPAVRKALLRPAAQLGIGAELLKSNLVSCGTDASDGLIGAMESIAQTSDVIVEVELDEFPLSPWARSAAKELGVDGRASALAWGDWQLVCAVSPENLEETMKASAKFGSSASVVGKVAASGPGAVVALQKGKAVALPEFVSRRFTGGQVNRTFSYWLDLVRCTRW